MKTCKKCNVEKDPNEFYFYKSKNYRDGLCKSCRGEINRNWRRNTYTTKEVYVREKLLLEGKNICFVCEQVKPLSAFRKSNHVKTGYHNTCKDCFSVADKNIKLKAAYGLNLDSFHDLLALQNNRCAICKVVLYNSERPSVDHCHDTGIIRGILCNTCNRGLGLLKDNTQTLYSAIRYLKLAQYKSSEFGKSPVVGNTELSRSEYN